MSEPPAPVRVSAPRDASWPRVASILVLAGFCLILLQFLMIREVTALLRGTEIVILLVTVAYFLGCSLGYGASRWLSWSRIRRLAWVVWAVHLTLPFSFRWMGGWIAGTAAGPALVVLLFLTAFVLSSFYSVLLPRLIDQAADGAESLVRYYGAELFGATVAVFILWLAPPLPRLLAVLYQSALGILIAILWARPAAWLAAAAGVVAYALVFPSAERASLDYCYATIHHLRGAETLSSVNTLYQKVDFLRDARGQRYIYLSGRENYGSEQLTRFNVYLSRLPARLIHPREALIVGSGSMESVRNISPLAIHVTTCELDAAVAAGSRRYLGDVNQIDRITNWTLRVEDARQYLGRTGKRFDLIVMDVPAPSTIQLGLLHSVEFYRLARQRLAPGGVISVSLCGTLAPDHATPRTIAAALVDVFPCVTAFTPSDAGFSFAVAGEAPPFVDAGVRDAALSLGAPEVEVFAPAGLREIIANARPIRSGDMRHVLWRSWEHITEFYLPGAWE